MNPIPKKLLIHEANVFHPEKGDWKKSNPEYIGKISRIRVDNSSQIVRDKNNAELQLSAVLFFDAKNSRGEVPKRDEVIEFMGERYRVVSSEPFFDEKKLHHYEIGMVRYV